MKELNLKPDDLLLAQSSIHYFTSHFFKDPTDPDVIVGKPQFGRAWHPYAPQIQLYNCIDYGYDILYNTYKPDTPAEIITEMWPRQYGKTEGIGSASAALPIMHRHTAVGCASLVEPKAKELLRRIAWFIESSPFASMIWSKKSDMIELNNNSYIQSFPQSTAIKGSSLTWLILDEAAQLDDKFIDEDSFPTTRTAGAFRRWKTPSNILLSTPLGPKGRFYDYYVLGLNNRQVVCRKCGNRRRLDHPDFINMRWHERLMPLLPPCQICGQVDYEYVPNKVISIVLDPWHHPTRTAAEIQQELDVRGNTPSARQELLAEVVTSGAGVFAREWLEFCTDNMLMWDLRPQENIRYVIGGDFGKLHDASVFVVGHLNEDNIIIIDYMRYIPAQGGLEYADIRYQLLSLVTQYNPHTLVLDATGIGNPIVEQIAEDINLLQTTGVSGKFKTEGSVVEYQLNPNPKVFTRIFSNKKTQLGFVFDYQSKLDLVQNLINIFQRKLIRIPPEFRSDSAKTLWREFINFAFEYTDNNRIKYGTQREHDDTVMAIGLLAMGLRSAPYYNVEPLLGGEDEFVL